MFEFQKEKVVRIFPNISRPLSFSMTRLFTTTTTTTTNAVRDYLIHLQGLKLVSPPFVY